MRRIIIVRLLVNSAPIPSPINVKKFVLDFIVTHLFLSIFKRYLLNIIKYKHTFTDYNSIGRTIYTFIYI